MNDLQLLRQYIDSGSEPAFAQIVERHVDMVYSTCVRLLRNRQDAEDATQAVFIILAQKARSLRDGTPLAAWLYHTARWAAASTARKNSIRRKHEAAASSSIDKTSAMESSSEHDLDAALGRLRAADRQVILLRYFEERSFAEVAGEMRLTEETARKRLNRAVDRLRQILRGAGEPALSVTLLEGLIHGGLHRAPPGLHIAVVKASVGVAASTTTGVSIAKGAMILMAVSKAKTVAVAAVAAVLLIGGGSVVTYKIVRPSSSEVVLHPTTAPAGPTRIVDRRIKSAQQDIEGVTIALSVYKLDTGRLPTTSEGLAALWAVPAATKGWTGPYISRPLVSDPWGNPYIYVSPGIHNPQGFDLSSMGPDGQVGGGDDVTNWTDRAIDNITVRTASAERLRRIAVAVSMYEAEWRGSLPPDMGTNYIYTRRVDDFIDPRRRATAPAEVKQMARPQLKAWVEQNSDYIWLGAGLKRTASKDTIIAAEKPEGLFDGINVMFVDGHVEFIAMADAIQRISAARERVQAAKATTQGVSATAPTAPPSGQ